MHVCVYVCACVYLSVYERVIVYNICVFVLCVCMCTCVICMYVYMYACMHTYLWSNVDVTKVYNKEYKSKKQPRAKSTSHAHISTNMICIDCIGSFWDLAVSLFKTQFREENVSAVQCRRHSPQMYSAGVIRLSYTVQASLASAVQCRRHSPQLCSAGVIRLSCTVQASFASAVQFRHLPFMQCTTCVLDSREIKD